MPNKLKIIILADSKEEQGGTNKVIKHIIKALDNTNNEIIVDYINKEKYMPKYLPKRWLSLYRIFYLRNISNDDYFKQFDIAITLQPDSHCIKHKNHIIYFQHHLRTFYDLFWYSFRLRTKLRRKIVFLFVTAINRLADKIYLTSNLKKTRVIVNSQTVGERLKKYNKIFNFVIINPPAVSNITDTIEESKIKTNQKITKELTELNNNKLIILSFSRLKLREKGIDLVLATALHLPSYQFIIAGPYDSTFDTIDKNTIPKNINLIVKDFSDEEKNTLFRKCDIFVAPYLNEDFGITPLEANAYGKPVVYCNDSGEIIYTQKHKITGYMSRRNPKEIAEGIEYCIKNKEKMRNACIENATKYTDEKFETSFRKYLFQEL
jgi:glycosyltransferase involved in cell wall biosynthesis